MACSGVGDSEERYLTKEEAHLHGLLVDFNVVTFDPLDPERCHTMTRHGPNLTDEQLKERFLPDSKHPARFSTRFLSEDALYFCREVFLQTVQKQMERELQEALAKGQTSFVYSDTMVFNQSIGIGFAERNQEFAALDITVVKFTYEWENDRWFEITAHPYIPADPTPHKESESIFEVR